MDILYDAAVNPGLPVRGAMFFFVRCLWKQAEPDPGSYLLFLLIDFDSFGQTASQLMPCVAVAAISMGKKTCVISSGLLGASRVR